MLRRPARLAALLVGVLLIAGCQIIITPFEPIVEATFSAQDTTSPAPLRSSVSIPAGQSLYYRLQTPVARDLLYGEVVGGGSLRVRMLDGVGRTLAVAQSPVYFAGSLSALTTSEAEVEAASQGESLVRPQIAVEFECLGPCVAVAPSTGDTYFLQVTNTSSQTRFFDLYAYTFAANDLNDRGAASNNTRSSATSFSSTGIQSGAIELVGDLDWFRYTGTQSRLLEFTALDPQLDLRLQFDDGTILTGLPGDRTTNLWPGDVFVVYSASGRAGPSGTSGYYLDVTP